MLLTESPDNSPSRKLTELSAGGTWLAEDAAGHQLVLKRLDPACLQDGALHPNVRDRLNRIRELPLRDMAVLHGIEQLHDEPMLVWDFLPGETLTECEIAGSASLARDISRLIDALHSHGIVHGNLHARNIIVGPDGRPQLTHFSPLLHYDPAVDQKQLATLLGNFEPVESPSRVGDVIDEDRRSFKQIVQSGSLWMAIALTVAAVAVGCWIYHAANQLSH